MEYGQKIQPVFWLKSQILVDWKGLFQRNCANIQTRNLQLYLFYLPSQTDGCVWHLILGTIVQCRSNNVWKSWYEQKIDVSLNIKGEVQ